VYAVGDAATEPNSLDATRRFAYRPCVLGRPTPPRDRSSETRFETILFFLAATPEAGPLILYCRSSVVMSAPPRVNPRNWECRRHHFGGRKLPAPFHRRYYADDVTMQENEQPPRVGKAACRAFEEDFLSKIKAVRTNVCDGYVISGNKAFIVYRIDADHADWGTLK
jgi:hypothetical protein